MLNHEIPVQQQDSSKMQFGHTLIELLFLHSSGKHPQSARLICMNYIRQPTIKIIQVRCRMCITNHCWGKGLYLCIPTFFIHILRSRLLSAEPLITSAVLAHGIMDMSNLVKSSVDSRNYLRKSRIFPFHRYNKPKLRTIHSYTQLQVPVCD